MSKYAIVTGGNTGMGLATCVELCKLGYFVTISVRSAEKGNEAVHHVKLACPQANISYLTMELASLDSVKNFASAYLALKIPLHLLVNNAGIMNTPYQMTVDGFEAQFQVNHLSHFLLTHQLLPLLKDTGGGRVINLSSRAHMRQSKPLDMNAVKTETPATYDGWGSYGRSKLCNILFARSLAKKFPLKASNVTFNALHPGLVDTGLLKTAPGLSAQAMPISEGIQTCMFLATNDSQIVSANPGLTSTLANSAEEADKLWLASLQMIGVSDAGYGV
jgi:NAD(P)-dependent dehydrogenase (short-subunit alcohol dehydrogenase family)